MGNFMWFNQICIHVWMHWYSKDLYSRGSFERLVTSEEQEGPCDRWKTRRALSGFVILFLSCMGSTHVSIVLCFVPFCFSYLLLRNKSPQHLVAENNTPWWSHSVCDSGIWAQLSWAPSSLYQSVWLRMLSSQGSTGHGFTCVAVGGPREVHFQAHSCGYWQDLDSHELLDQGPQFLTGCCPKASLGSLLCGPLHRAAYNMAARFIRVKTLRDKEEDGVTVFYKVLMKEISYHLCCILFIRSRSLGLAHTREVRNNGDILQVRLAQHAWNIL